jgi:hypothetical protein
MEIQLNQNINVLSDQRDKIIIMKDKQYIIDKNKLYTTKDSNKISIDGVDNDKLCCIKEDGKSKILLDIDEIIFNDYEMKDSVPYVFYDDTKIFFNQREQKLIKTDKIVTVIGYAGEGLMLCKCEDGSEIKYKPEEDFVNFKDFANVIKNRNRRNIDNDYPTVKFISNELDSKIIYAKVFPNMQDTKCKINDEIKEGKIIGNSPDKSKLVFKYDDKEVEVLLDDVENNYLIKDKATIAVKKRQNNPKILSNVINIEKNVNEGKSYLDVASKPAKKEIVKSTSSSDNKELKKSSNLEYDNLKKEHEQLKKKYKKVVNYLIDNDIDFEF